MIKCRPAVCDCFGPACAQAKSATDTAYKAAIDTKDAVGQKVTSIHPRVA